MLALSVNVILAVPPYLSTSHLSLFSFMPLLLPMSSMALIMLDAYGVCKQDLIEFGSSYSVPVCASVHGRFNIGNHDRHIHNKQIR